MNHLTLAFNSAHRAVQYLRDNGLTIGSPDFDRLEAFLLPMIRAAAKSDEEFNSFVKNAGPKTKVD
jgi:hypothetical protein